MGKFYAIGVGPGDSELITLKAKKVLEKADVIFAPFSDNKSVALDIVKEYINYNKVIKLAFPMTKNKDILKQNWKIASDVILKQLKHSNTVAFITLGDTAFYSTFSYVKDVIIENGFDVEIIAGITSFSAGAAAAGITLSENCERVVIIPYLSKDEKLEFYLDNFETIILMKVFKSFNYVKDVIIKKGLLNNCTLFSNVGMDNELIFNGVEILNADNLGYFTTLIIHNRKD